MVFCLCKFQTSRSFLFNGLFFEKFCLIWKTNFEQMHCTLLVLVNFCPFLSEFLKWNYVYNNFWNFGKKYQCKYKNFHFCQIIKSFSKQNSMLRIYSKPDRNWEELSVCTVYIILFVSDQLNYVLCLKIVENNEVWP